MSAKDCLVLKKHRHISCSPGIVPMSNAPRPGIASCVIIRPIAILNLTILIAFSYALGYLTISQGVFCGSHHLLYFLAGTAGSVTTTTHCSGHCDMKIQENAIQESKGNTEH